jgi:cytoskeleton protein RodZ
MESLGQKLKEARETHHYSLEQVSRDTHISKQYLRALEEEDFSSIPGETYVIGFLRNYAEYLALNPEEMVTLYKNMKIQEQPLPMTELLEKHPQRPRSLGLLLVLAAVVILGAGGYLVYRLIASGRAPAAVAAGTEAAAANPLPEKEAYLLQEEVLTRWFSLEDIIQVPVNGNQYPLQLTAIGDTLTVQVPGASLELAVGQERLLDFNNDARFDIRLLLNDLDASGEIKRANLGFYKMTRGAVAAAEAEAAGQPEPAAEEESGQEESGQAESGQAESGQAAEQEVESAAVPAPSPATPVSGLAILQSSAPEPFRVTVNFRGYCLFRFLLDGEREERFFHKGENFSLDVKNEINLWLSNAGALKMMIAGRDVDLGKPGEVAAKNISWIREESSGQYSLRVSTLD